MKEKIVCSQCGTKPKKIRIRKDGTQGLPFKWSYDEEKQVVCPKCKPKKDTCNWVFDCKPPNEGRAVVDEQMLKAHRYRNNLVELERSRRDKSLAAIRAINPRVAELEQAMESIEEELTVARQTISTANTIARKRTATREQRDQVKAIVKRKQELYKEWKAERDPVYTHPEVVAVNDWVSGELKRLRAECGCYWGTYSLVEMAAKSFGKNSPPEFRSLDVWPKVSLDNAQTYQVPLTFGYGRVGVQLQGGLKAADVMAAKDTRFRIELTGRTKRGGKPEAIAWVRIGSDDHGVPVWGKVIFTLHRPLPSDAVLKWAVLKREREATHERWTLVLTMSFTGAGKATDQAQEGSVGVDIGWRRRPDGSLRVAYWVGDDGRHGELVLPAAIVNRWPRASGLASTRDTNFNHERDALITWLANHPYPDWLKEHIEYLPQWKSKARLSGLVLLWRNKRFDGDGEIYEKIEAWRKQDRHLEEWEGCERFRADRARLDLYRRFAAWLRRQYRTVCLEKINWREAFQDRPKPEEKGDSEQARHYYRTASPGLLQETLRKSFAQVIDRVPEHTTNRCHVCHELDAFDAEAELVRTCRHCSHTDDQDRRAAINLLAASDDVINKILVTARESEVLFSKLLTLLGYTGTGVPFGSEEGGSRGKKRMKQLLNRLKRRP